MTLVETLVSTALTLMVTGAVLTLANAGQTIARTQPEAADVQQRARLALQTLGGELRGAGAGLDRGALAGPLVRYFPPIEPAIDGGITLWSITHAEAQGLVAAPVNQGATAVVLADSASCLSGEGACGFESGASAIAFTADGCRTVFRLSAVADATLRLTAPLTGCTLDAGSAVGQGEVRTFYVDSAARQLIRRDEITGSTTPVLDGVAAMTTTYFADAGGMDIVSGTSDAELMRVRRVRITLRFAAFNGLLRIPDLTLAVDVTPRNLEGG